MDDVRAFEASCPVHAASAIRHIDGVAPAESIGMLADWMASPDAKHDDDALPAIAYHADPAATRLLASRAEPSRERKEREDALFWLGEARGEDGAAIVERYATTDGDPKLREHAIFALSQSHAGDPYERIHAIAGSDPSEHVRSQAMFWMAQMGDKRAAHDITAAIALEPLPTTHSPASTREPMNAPHGVTAAIALAPLATALPITAPAALPARDDTAAPATDAAPADAAPVPGGADA